MGARRNSKDNQYQGPTVETRTKKNSLSVLSCINKRIKDTNAEQFIADRDGNGETFPERLRGSRKKKIMREVSSQCRIVNLILAITGDNGQGASTRNAAPASAMESDTLLPRKWHILGPTGNPKQREWVKQTLWTNVRVYFPPGSFRGMGASYLEVKRDIPSTTLLIRTIAHKHL